jgi:hypothetical protein
MPAARTAKSFAAFGLGWSQLVNPGDGRLEITNRVEGSPDAVLRDGEDRDLSNMTL